MKKGYLILAFIISLIFIMNISYAAMTEDLSSIYIDDNEIKFDVPPQIVNEEALVPMKILFEALGAQVLWVEESQEVIGYKNNTFIKLKIDDNMAYINGFPTILNQPPVVIDSRTLVPATFVAETFDLSSNEFSDEFSSENPNIYFNTKDRDYIYKKIDNYYYNSISLSHFGFHISLPTNWAEIDNRYNYYGTSDTSGDYSIEMSKLPLDLDLSLDKLTEILKSSMKAESKDTITFTGESKVTVNNLDSNVVFYQIENEDSMDYFIYYVLYEDMNAYIFKCNYTNSASEEFAIDQFNNIINTLQIDYLSLDESMEHYIEYQSFFDYGVNLSSDMYSNMGVNGDFNFAGTIGDHPEVKGFEVLVSKNDEAFYYYVPVVDYAFDASIVLPFGLGKHNVSISIDVEGTGYDIHDDLETPDDPIELDANTESFEISPEITTVLGDTEDTTVLTDKILSSDTYDLSSEDLTDSEIIEVISKSLEEYVESAINSNTHISSDNLLMKLSLINLSNDSAQYLLNTSFVETDDPGIRSTANALTYTSTNDPAKAFNIYKWILSTIEYEPNYLADNLQTSTGILSSNTGNEMEINFLYAALLRSINIQSRIVKGVSQPDEEDIILDDPLTLDLPLENSSDDLLVDSINEVLDDSSTLGDTIDKASNDPSEDPLDILLLLEEIEAEAETEAEVEPQPIIHYWTEIYLNGKWYVSDISADILNRKTSGLPGNYINTLFRTDATEYHKDYDKIEILLF